MPMRGAPKCKLCGHQHDLREPHVFDGPKKPLTPVREAEAPLTPTDLARLGELEAIIDPRIRDWIIVGEALTEIRDKRLYRATHETFETYCQERWLITRRRANQMIGGAAVAGVLGTGFPNALPVTEKAVRPLVSLPPAKQREVYAATVARVGPAPTGPDVKETIAMQAAPSIAAPSPDPAKLEPETGDSPATGENGPATDPRRFEITPEAEAEAAARVPDVMAALVAEGEPVDLGPIHFVRTLDEMGQSLGLPPGALDPPPLTYADVHHALERSAGAFAEAAELLEDMALSSRDRRDLLAELDSFGRAISRLQQLIQVKA